MSLRELHYLSEMHVLVQCMPWRRFSRRHPGISPHQDLLTALSRHFKVRSVAASTAPAGRGRISFRSNQDEDFFPRKRVVWLALAAALFASLAPLPAASESPSLRPWIEPSPEGPQRTFSLDDLRGTPRDLQAFKGNVVLLHFFATWCEPCVRELSSLQKLASIARDKPLKIVAIDVAEVDLRVRAFFEKWPVDFPVLLDRDRAVTKAWQVSALPSTVVLAPDLTPRLFIEGDLDWSRPDVLTTIETLYPAATRDTEPITIQTINNPREETTR